MHDDRRAQFLGILGPFIHLLGCRRRNVQVVAFTFPGLTLGLMDRLHNEVESLAPAHERLRVDVLVILSEIQPAT